MGTIPFDEEDYYTIAKNRTTFAWEDKPVFDRYLRVLLGELYTIQQIFKDLMQLRYIDTATGYNLDLIGIIVGQSRVILEADAFPYFGYENAPEAQSYGTINDPSVGGYYWDINKPKSGSVVLNDEQYRMFIKSKIIRNTTNCTPEQIIEFVQFIYDVDQVMFYDGNTEFYVFIGKNLTPFEKAVINYHQTLKGYESYFIPKPAGVKVYIGEFPSDEAFCFEGVEDGLGYSTLDEPDVGGVWTILLI